MAKRIQLQGHTHTYSFLLIQIHQRVSHNTLTGWSLGASVGWHSHSMSPIVCWDYLHANSHPSNIKHGLSRLSTHGTTLRLRKITSHRFRESLCRCSSLFSRFEKFNFCTVIANRCTQMTLCVLHFNGKGYTVQKKVCALDAFCSFALGTCPLKRWCS